MTSASPWSVKGIDPKAREIAKDLARRSGMTLGEWLNQMIIEGEAEAPPVEPGYRGVPARDFTPPGEPFRTPATRSPDLEGVRQIVDQLAARIEAAEQRSTLAISGVDQSVMGVLSRLEAVERDQTAVATRFDAVLNDLGQSHQSVADGLQALTRTVSDREADERAAIQALRDEFHQVAEKVGTGFERGEIDPSSGVMDAVVSRIAGRLEEAEQRTAEAVKSLEASFAELDARLRASEAASTSSADVEVRRFEGLTAELTARVEASREELAERLRELATGRIERIEAGIGALQHQVEARERRSAQALDRMGREVMRIASSLSDRVARAEVTSAEAVDRVSGEVAKLSSAVDRKFSQQELVQAEALERLGGEISRIAEKLTERITHAERRSTQSVDDMGQQLGHLSERLSQRLEQSHSELSERLRQSEARTSRFIEEAQTTIGGRLGDAGRRVDAEAPVEPPPVSDVGRFVFEPADDEAAEHKAAPERAAEAFVADPFAETDPFEIDPFADDPFVEPVDEAAAGAALRRHSPTIADLSDGVETEAEFEPLKAFPTAASLQGAAPTERSFHFGPESGPESSPERGSEHGVEHFDVFAPGEPAVHDEPAEFLSGADEEPAFELEPEFATVAPAAPDLAAKRELHLGPPDSDTGVSLTTREVVERARAAARQASERPDLRGRRGGDGPPKGSVEAPALETKGSKGFGFPFAKKKKKEGVTVRTALLASGTAAALAVTGAGALLLVNSEMAGTSDRQADHFGVAPTAAINGSGDGSETAQATQTSTTQPSITPPPTGAATAAQAPGKVEAAVALSPSVYAAASASPVQAAVAPASPPPAAAGPAPAEPASLDAAKALYSAAVRRIAGDDFGGVDSLKKSANLGYAPAQFYLAKLYETGGAGLAKDMVAARRWTERAAAGGDPAAMHNLGLYFYEGEGGPQDAAQAAEWFHKAAVLGIRDSQYNLALLYSKGYGVPQNLTEAYTWYLVAAISGDDGAKAAARAIRSQLSPAAQSAAERSAAAFKVQTQAASRATLASNTP